MGAVFFVNSPAGVRKALASKGRGIFRYVVFQRYRYVRESQRLASAGGIPVDASELFSEVDKGFRSDFVSWMGELNAQRSSEFWLRLNLAGKSALSAQVCERAFYSVCLTRATEKFPEDLVAVLDDTAVVRQIERNRTDREVLDFRTGRRLHRVVLAEWLPGKIVHRLGIVLWRKFISGAAGIVGSRRRLVVVKTVVSEESFDAAGAYRDVYFGALIDFLRNQGRELLVVGLVLSGYKRLLEHSKRRAEAAVYSIEQALSYRDIFACFLRALRAFYSGEAAEGPTPPLRGVDMREIVRRSVMEELRSAQHVVVLMNARATENMVRSNDIERFILPFENRGYERADIQVLRARSPRTRIVGYQHAAVTPKHTEYFLSEKERMPAPDVILSTGEAAARFLVELGGHPSATVKTSCALRQRGGFVVPARRPALGRVLVLLSTSADYYERTIDALNGLLRDGAYTVRLRAHPLIPLKKSVKSKIAFPYEEEDFSTHDAAIDWADVAVYSSSTTLAFNCLQRGKPVIRVPVDDFMDSDPLFEVREVKWTARTADEFKRAMAEIRAIGDDDWQSRFLRAQDYVRRVFEPASERSMRTFLE